MKKLTGSKLPVEVKGNMSPEGADRVGMLMTITMLIDKLWWKIAIVIGLTALTLNSAYTDKLILNVANPNELTRSDTAYACLVGYHPHKQLIELKCSRMQGQ